MLYKVTPMLPVPAPKTKKPRAEGPARKRRATTIYDAEGKEVLITLMCLKCKKMKPLAQFGLRKMADGAIRNQPWCRPCRSGAGVKPRKDEGQTQVSPAQAPVSPVSLVAPAAVVASPEPASVPVAEALIAAEPEPLFHAGPSIANGVETVRVVPVMPASLADIPEAEAELLGEETQPQAASLPHGSPFGGYDS